MKLLFLIIVYINFGFSCRAQVFDDFSDGDFKENPTWLGSDSSFIINDDKQLQLNATTAGNAWLSVNCQKKDEMEWQFWIKEKFSPSQNNYCDVYLLSDSQDLTTNNQSYILRFGESGGEDVIRLLRFNSHEGFINICSGSDTFIASSFSVFVKVTLDKSGTWKIFVDKKGDGFFQLEAEGKDENLHLFDDSTFFGFNCNYTNSNVKQFYFDDIYIGERIIDSVAPELLSCEITDNYHLELKFSEAIIEDVALDTKNFHIEDDIYPQNVIYGNELSTIILEFDTKIEEEIYQTLTIENIEDYEGNISDKICHTFLYYNAKAYDIVINEIMSDPSPNIGLPEYEYIELYNVSNFPISLNNWKFKIGNTEYKIMQKAELKAKEYLILCHDDAVEALSEFGDCHGFSSFQIANLGTEISLFDKKDLMISSIGFDISWHSAAYKEEGGWALEQIDYENPCAGKLNWGSSTFGSGGTPGKINSIYKTNIIYPKLDYLYPDSINSIELFFNQNMNMESLLNIDNYFIKEMQIHPSEIHIIPHKNNYVRLVFNQDFDNDGLYTLNISNVRNCNDINLNNEIDIRFGIPTTADSNDIIINEILFDPISPGVDYLEIYNRSDKVIDLNQILIGTIKESFPNPPDTITKVVCKEKRIFLPHSYMLISSDKDIVNEQYINNHHQDNVNECFIETKDFPSFSNEDGIIIICDKSRNIIDEVYYSEKMHYNLLIETKGVALERIAFENPSMDKDNWHSASYNVNYGTPGYENSMAMNEMEEIKDDEISIIPEIFSPDGDSFDDNCAICYRFENKGMSLNVKIFNSEGILIKTLLNNSLINDEGFVIWDGCDDNKRVVIPGIYIVQAEVFDLKGFVKRIRKVVTITIK